MKVGASTSIEGLVGVIVGYYIINLKGLEKIEPVLKDQVFCRSVVIAILAAPFSFRYSPGIDMFGHLGGFIGGFFLASLGTTIINTKR